MDLTKSLLQGIQILIERALETAPFDKTFVGVITAIDGDIYTVKINGQTYNIPYVGSKTLAVNNTVKVMFPQNQATNAFIIG